MASSYHDGRVAPLFTEDISCSAEEELRIDESAPTVSLASNLFVVPDPSVAVQEGEECVRDLLDHLSGEENAASYLAL